MSVPFSVHAIVLAAGGSTRLGRNKQLVTLDGETLVARCVRITCAAGLEQVTVVTGFEHERIDAALAGMSCRTVYNPDWANGMGSSIRMGIEAACATSHKPDAVLIILPDQLRIAAAHLRALLDTATVSPHAIIATRYAGTLGVPAIFKRKHFEELGMLPPKAGAKALMARHLADAVVNEDAAFDLDTPHDLHALTSRGGRDR